MDIEEFLNPEGEHGSGIETFTDDEILKILREEDTEPEFVADIDADALKMKHVTRSEALKAANLLCAYTSVQGESWACTLEATLQGMTCKTCHKEVENMKLTLITRYFTSQ